MEKGKCLYAQCKTDGTSDTSVGKNSQGIVAKTALRVAGQAVVVGHMRLSA